MRETAVRRILVPAVLVMMACLPLKSFSQKPNYFSGDSTKFTGELNAIFFNLADNEKKIIAPYMENFIQIWSQEKFSAAQKKVIYTIFNEMVKKKIRPYPDFFNYVNTLNIFTGTNQPAGYFAPWSEILLKLLAEKNSTRFLAFLETTRNLFAEQLLYKSSTTSWKVNPAAFRFRFDTVPVLEFSKCDLTCYANDDSLNIYATRGVYYPLTSTWKGETGQVNWKRAGEDPAKVYATLGLYGIQMRFSKFTADSVSLTNKKYFPSPVLGRYTDKVLADVTEEKASYPRFSSYDQMIGISRLFNNIDYLGGFAMEGGRIMGTGDRNRDARLFFKKDGKDFVIARSKSFIIRPDRINAMTASITIYYEDDSIFHPGLQLKYMDDKKELSFTKDERTTSTSPWFDSFHKIEIYCEALYWIVGQPKISFEMMKGPTKESKAVFESSKYYSSHRYEKMQGIDKTNPLDLLKSFTEQRKTKEFSLEELTKFLNKPAEQVEVQLMQMATRGFLVYDYENKRVRIKDKLYSYVNAYNGRADYDVIYFNSFVTNASNGVLFLDSFDLKLQGVPLIVLSDSQQVKIYPKNSEIVLKKDMDFLFSGKMEAGLFDFYTRDCYFDYSKFKADLPTIDSMLFYVQSKTFDPKTRTYPLIRMKTAVTNLSGELLIDDPKNKSGRKAIKQYPVFINKNNALVYYNNGTIQKGVYSKENFFYEVKPFTINSLDDIATDSLRFTGSLVTAGIFPQIDEPLKVRSDFSLGLEKMTDSAGLPVYGGKGTFYSKVDLSNRGLHGDGTLKYLNSTSQSTDFTFLPDSMKAMVRNFRTDEVAGAVEYPAVNADSVVQFWLPNRDSLLVASTTRVMGMYNNQSTFAGTLALTPRMLNGDGTVRIKDAEMDSRGFKFRRRSFDALIANFRIKSYDLADLTISTKNYQTHFDFDQRKGEFKSNIGISKVEFPLNRYICSMDRFDWLIDSEEIQLSNEQSKKKVPDSLSLSQLIDLAYTGSEFISVHPLQDSLKFFAARANYNLRTNIINAQDVKIIKVADAAVYPDSGRVVILKDAVLQTLQRAIIIANTDSRHHQFYNADVSISSRKNYSGRGDYDYIDRTGQREKIRFDQIRIDSARQTAARGSIPDSANFLLSPEFAFYGDVALRASVKNLFFEGGFHPVSTCFSYNEEWVKFACAIDPAHVQIPVNAPMKNMAGDPVNLGMMFFNSETRISPSFFRRKVSYSDTTMITANGLIEYNLPTSEFRVARPEKLKNLAEKGDFFSLNNFSCMIRGEGKLNLSLKSGNFKMENYGTLDYYIIPDSLRVRCSMAFDFPFSESGLERFSTQLTSINLPGVKLMSTPYAMAIGGMLSKQEFDRLTTEQELVGKYKKFPEALERSLFLADVTLKWDSTTRSYVSNGSIGVASIGKSQVNRYTRGIIEFTKKPNGDEFTIYLELTKDDWYYFNYRNNLLQAFSSDLAFNDIIREAAQSSAERKRVTSKAKGFNYTLSTERKKREFLRKFQEEGAE